MIRIWIRTAVQKRVTSYYTFFSTLCHESCHDLDCERVGFRDTSHIHHNLGSFHLFCPPPPIS